MERGTKIFLLVFGGILIAGSIGLGVYLHLKKKKEEEEQETNENERFQDEPGTNDSSQSNEPETQVDLNRVTPQFNVENELSNPIYQIKGRYLYPKRTSQGGWGYANVRTSAEVNNDTGIWLDGISNLLTTINSGVPIGKVLSEKAEVFNDYSYRWFKVKLAMQVPGWFSNYTEGYVRADTVTFKPYSK